MHLQHVKILTASRKLSSFYKFEHKHAVGNDPKTDFKSKNVSIKEDPGFILPTRCRSLHHTRSPQFLVLPACYNQPALHIN